MAKRLYRFLDKRFYRGGTVEADLRTLAERTVRLSASNDAAQHKRQLLKGVAELEREWELKPADPAERFRREARGKWTVVFERKRRSAGVATGNALTGVAADLAAAGVSATMAARLASDADERTVRTMLALFEHYRATGKRRDAGFLVNCVRDPGSVRFPPNFMEPKPAIAPDGRRADARDQSGGKRLVTPSRERREPNTLHAAFESFWESLPEAEREAFESAALAECDAFLRDGLRRTRETGGPAFDQYRKLLLTQHFDRTRSAAK